MIWIILLTISLIPAAGPAFADSNETDRCIEAVGLCEIVDGRRHETLISVDELLQADPLATQGYISEIVLYSPHDEIDARIVEEPADDDQRLAFSKKTTPRWRAADVQPIRHSRDKYRLVITPKIKGDCISPEDELTVSVSSPHGGAIDLKIRQKGYKTVFEAPAEKFNCSRPIVFRLLGGSTEDFKTHAARERILAMSEGIRKIEQAYGQELVHSVNIIDLKGYNNALSLKGQNEFWIYADTFWGYEDGELRSMASHETLHIFVDSLGLTEKPIIRELYADLIGLDAESKERLSLMTTGHLPRGYASRYKPASPFWGFINERHFIEGMSGGHASDNIDEFCTSFLHSLLYSDRLEENLAKAISAVSRKPARVMTPEERRHLMSLYRRAVEVFQSVAGNSDQPASVESVCSQTLESIERLSCQN